MMIELGQFFQVLISHLCQNIGDIEERRVFVWEGLNWMGLVLELMLGWRGLRVEFVLFELILFGLDGEEEIGLLGKRVCESW